jgi:hypothetical protein
MMRLIANTVALGLIMLALIIIARLGEAYGPRILKALRGEPD